MLNLDREGLTAFFASLGEKPFRASQIMKWIHQQDVSDFQQMSNISKSLRDKLEAIAEINKRKAAKLYAAIDASGFYANPVALNNRSIMNVPFTLADASLDAKFLAEAEAAGLLNLQGHRSVGGMRASIYNAVSESSVDALVEFMADFERRWG